RLQMIQELRDQEWIRQLPRKLREKVEEVQGADRAKLIKQYRDDERRRRREWAIAFRHWDELMKKQPLPSTLGDFPPPVRTYVTEYLGPWLSEKERNRLDKADGQWPAYPRALVLLADRHPMALPGPRGPTHFNELPAEVVDRLAFVFPSMKKGGKTF